MIYLCSNLEKALAKDFAQLLSIFEWSHIDFNEADDTNNETNNDTNNDINNDRKNMSLEKEVIAENNTEIDKKNNSLDKNQEAKQEEIKKFVKEIVFKNQEKKMKKFLNQVPKDKLKMENLRVFELNAKRVSFFLFLIGNLICFILFNSVPNCKFVSISSLFVLLIIIFCFYHINSLFYGVLLFLTFSHFLFLLIYYINAFFKSLQEVKNQNRSATNQNLSSLSKTKISRTLKGKYSFPEICFLFFELQSSFNGYIVLVLLLILFFSSDALKTEFYLASWIILSIFYAFLDQKKQKVFSIFLEKKFIFFSMIILSILFSMCASLNYQKSLNLIKCLEQQEEIAG